MRFDSTPEEPQVMSDDAVANRRLMGGILVSLIAHALVLSLQFGIPGLDLPSLEVPWKERRTPVQTLQVEIASPAPKAAPVPPTPAVTTPELFKLPTPILPAPIPKMTAPPTGLQVLAMQSKPEPVPPEKKPAKSVKSKPVPPLPIEKRVPPPSESPTRIIAQDKIKNDDFVVPLTSEEDLERHTQDKKETKQKLEAIPEDAIIDKNAEADLIAEQKRQEELKQKKIAQEKILAEQKQQEAERLQQIAKANEEKQKQQEAERLQQIQQTNDLKRQQAEQLAQHKILAQQKAAVEQKQREQALEEAMREAKRQELLTQETLKQEEQSRQAEQKRLRQLAQEQEQQKQEAQAQAQLRQKLAEEQAEKKRALEIAERQRQEDLEAKRVEAQRQLQIAEQKATEQKQLEQRLLEQKIAEQKIAEQRAFEQKIAQQKLAEQKLAEQKLAEQKLAEQKAQEQKLAEQKALADAARANAEREAAIAASRQTGASNRSDVNGDGKGGTGSSSNANSSGALTQNLGKGDLASRLREQARNTDLLKSTPSNSKLADEKSARRRSFLGAYDKEVPLRMYVDSLKHKLERNGNLIYERRTLSEVEHNVQINMVVRSDGSIEEVTIMRSSGSRAIDEKARNIIMANSPYSAFPPALALKYDVIEVQRVWSFGDKLRILDNLPSAF